MTAPFAHLHLHSEYSLVDSTIRISELIAQAKAAGMPALALTDEANVFALARFYRECEKAGIKPIAGCDLWLAEGKEAPTRFTLLVQHREGLRSLSRLLTRAYRERDPVAHTTVERRWLEEHRNGLFVLLGPGSDVAQRAAAGRERDARQRLVEWQAAFGDRCYLELTRCGRAEESAWTRHAPALATIAGTGVVVSNDVRFLAADDFEAHEARVAIHEGYILSDPKRPKPYSREQYLKDGAAMHALFADLPVALDNTLDLARRCNLEMSFGKYALPAYPTASGEAETSVLRREAIAGLEQRLQVHGIAEGYTRHDYDARLTRELDVIEKMGFAGYFLVVADFIGWGKRNGIPVGPGRGSGAGSLVAWVIAITDLDPLRYELLFERFLNPERVSMPDFDIDFCMDRRDEVIDYVGERYGREKVSQIITYGTMAAKAVLRDTGRVLGMAYGHVDRIAKLVPSRPLDISLDDALGVSEKAAKEPDRVSAEFKQAYADDEQVKALVDLARKLEDLTRNAGKHAGGVVIAPTDLTDFVPLYAEARGEGMVTQFDKDDVEAIGLVKFDFLGLRTLTIIDWAVKAINARHGAGTVDIATLATDDPATYRLLTSGRTTAIFQLESRGMKELAKKLKPGVFDEIIALGALFRPGPLQSGMVDEFVERKHGRREVTYPHPLLEPILKPTYGVIVYQEQVMQIAQVLAGYSLGGADLLRRAMGKKKPEEMAKERVKFETGAAENKVDAQLASSIFDLMEKFAEYGFNKSHSAAYALVTYQTAWLKTHYPAEFMAAVLSSDMDNTDKLTGFLEDAKDFGLSVTPPAINAGTFMFEAVGAKEIRYGLGAVKGVGQGAVEAIVAERARGGAYASIDDLCQRVDPSKLNKKVLEALILSGALDALGANRATLWEHLPKAMQAADQRLRALVAGQNDMFGAAAPLAAASTVKAVDEWPLLRRLEGERNTLGHYLSGHPTDTVADQLAQIVTAPLAKMDEIYRPPAHPERRGRPEAQPVTIAGMVVDVRRRGESMAFVQIEDGSGRFDVSFFRESLVENAPLLTMNRLLVIEGNLQMDDFNGRLEVRAKSAQPLEVVVERRARALQLSVESPPPDFAQRLRAALQPHVPGSAVIRVAYRSASNETLLEFGSAWRVRAGGELRSALEELAGVTRVDLVLGRPEN